VAANYKGRTGSNQHCYEHQEDVRHCFEPQVPANTTAGVFLVDSRFVSVRSREESEDAGPQFTSNDSVVHADNCCCLFHPASAEIGAIE